MSPASSAVAAMIRSGMDGANAHVNHDLPVAMVSTCAALATSPYAGQHFVDYQKVGQLLDAAEQSIRQSFETTTELGVDHHLSAVATSETAPAGALLISRGLWRRRPGNR